MNDRQRMEIEHSFDCAASTYNDCISEAMWELRRAANAIDGYIMPLIDDETSKGSAHIAELYTRNIESIKALESRVNAAMAALVSQTYVVNEDCAAFVKMMADDERAQATHQAQDDTFKRYTSTLDGMFDAMHGDSESRNELLQAMRALLADYIPEQSLDEI